jgi:hypothetical protein
MCLTQGGSASTCASPRIAPDSGAGCMARAVLMSARSATPSPLTIPSSHLDSALEVLEHVGGRQPLATFHQPVVTQGNRWDGRTRREGGAPWRRLDRKTGGFRGKRKRREPPPSPGSAQFRAGRQGRDPGRENSLPP